MLSCWDRILRRDAWAKMSVLSLSGYGFVVYYGSIKHIRLAAIRLAAIRLAAIRLAALVQKSVKEYLDLHILTTLRSLHKLRKWV